MKKYFVFTLLVAAARCAWGADFFVYFGSHTSKPGTGFSIAHFDTDTGLLSSPRFLLEAKEPAYFVTDTAGKFLYTCNSGSPGGASAYEINPHTGALKLINRVLAGGVDTSYLSLDKTGRYALVANYDGGNIAVFAIRPDGGLGDYTAFDQHKGTSVDPVRQTHAYAHSIQTDPSNRFVLATDLGVDKIYIYRFDEKTGSITPNTTPFVAVAGGLGPRHLRFHPNGKRAYLINEMGSSIIGFNWDGVQGKLEPFQTISTLPADFKGPNACAEIDIHPSGKFLYATNRGHDSVVVFAIDPETGQLSLVQHISCGGKMPRNFTFDPTGHWIVLGNHDSNNVLVYTVDSATGRLTQHGDPITVPTPYCPRFLPVR